ncbi:PVC-type heme-binding CxxCH protein [Planctomicrobium sp. SH664]|uniref:PVC-type heme-binding CxxCH protein n=1 Tax=Planctomicrobium sp. SH664 TaxID=3448125 RepID=UPI003F5C7305
MRLVSTAFIWLAVWFCIDGTSAAAADLPQNSTASEAELAIQSFQFPAGMNCELWAAEPLLANPVAFCLDEQGRIYVCETYRQQKGVEDNRSHKEWLAEDLRLTTVEERLEMLKRHLGDQVSTYMQEEDRIRLLVDTDGDGRADQSTLFATGFNGILDGTGAGLLAIDGDVYFTCIPSLYLLRDRTGDGIADEKETLSTGYGVRVAFRGHDLHGLTLGPDGRIYFSIGDRGFNVEVRRPEGDSTPSRRLILPDQGAVFRCERDGTGLEIVAEGLRNPQELAFDDYGNLFTCDNNSDGGDEARWVHVVEGGDSGWRMYFQYLPDRGPWNRERIWSPYRADDETTAVQPAHIIPPLANIANGPSGLVAYPGVGLPAEYSGHFFLADFRGSSGQSGIRAIANEPRGATFHVTSNRWFLEHVLATDVDFGSDGWMYVSDWVEGWNGPGKGRIYRLGDPRFRQTPAIQEAHELMKAGFKDLSADRLVELLGHPDRRIRQRSQFELARREAVELLAETAARSQAEMVRIHALWGLGELIRKGTAPADLLLPFLADRDPEIRAQVARLAGDCMVTAAVPQLLQCMKEGTPRLQSLAAMALGKLEVAEAFSLMVEGLERNADSDPVLRHAFVMGLAGGSTPEQLLTLLPHDSRAVRLGAVLALRRLKSPLLQQFLHDPDAAIALEAARAIHDLPIVAAQPALATCFAPARGSDPFARRVLNANFRLGGPEQALAVAEFAADSENSETLRLEALHELLLWDNPPDLDRVTNEHRPLLSRDSPHAAASAVQQHFRGMLQGSEAITAAAMDLLIRYPFAEAAPELLAIVDSASAPAPLRCNALAAICELDLSEADTVLRKALADQSMPVRIRALELFALRQPTAAIPLLEEAIQSQSAPRVQSALVTTGKLDGKAADQLLLESLNRLSAGKILPEAELELLEAAAQRTSPEIQDRLAALVAERKQAPEPLAGHQELLRGGDAARGREVFFGSTTASCQRCHSVDGKQAQVGPDLSSIGSQQPREYLLESMLFPNAKIAQNFETVVLQLADGRVVTGTLRGENEETVTLLLPSGETATISKSEIEERGRGRSGMPDDAVKQLSRGEIRDLVEYLSTLKKGARKEKRKGH